MQILLLKIALAPLIITICTLLTRRYGHTIGGTIVGLPLTSGPVAFILALQHDEKFVADFSNGIIFGVSIVATFSIIYSYASKKFHWTICTLLGWIAYFIQAKLLKYCGWNLWVSFGIVVIYLVMIIYLFPKQYDEISSIKVPAWDIPVRIIAALTMVFLITWLSDHIGAQLSGILSTLPVYATIFGASTHFHYGSNSTIKLFRGILNGSFSFAIFFLALGKTITILGIAGSFLFSVVVAVIMQLIVQKVMQLRINN